LKRKSRYYYTRIEIKDHLS